MWPPPHRARGPVHDPDLARGPLPDAAARKAELALMRDLLDRVYAHRLDKIARYQLDETALFADAERKLLAARTWGDYDAALYALIVPFHDGHLSYHPPPTAAPAKGYASFHMGLETVLASGHLLVASVEPDSDVARAGVKPGDQVVAIDRKPIADVLVAAVQGRAWSRPQSAQVTWARTWTHVLYPLGEAPRRRTLTVERRSGGQLDVAVLPREVARQPHDAVAERRDGAVEIVAIRSLEGNRERAHAIETALAAVRDAPALVIDLRGNRGGVDFVADRVIAALGEGRVPLATYRVLVAPETIVRRPRWKNLAAEADGFSAPQTLEVDAQPVGHGFHGQLAVVIDAGCVSSCEMIAAALRADLHATLVGETTGGSSGAPIEIALPASRGKLALPTWNLISADGKPVEGDGVVPDLAVEPTADALAAGDDLALRAAVHAVQRP